MSLGQRRLRGGPRRAALAVLAVALAFHASAALAGPKKAKKYHFELVEEVAVNAAVPADVGAELTPVVKELVTAAFTGNPRLVAVAGGPDPRVDGKGFKKFLTKKKIAGAYRVNVEILAYEESLEALEAPRSGQRLNVHVALRMFGETIPDRVMAFAGDGTATIRMDIGNKLRPRDRQAAHHDAVELAIADAITASMSKLDKPPPKPKK